MLIGSLNLTFIQSVTANDTFAGHISVDRPQFVQKKLPVLLGLYTRGYLGDQSVIDQELRSVDLWTGNQTSLAGLFIDLAGENLSYNVTRRLEKLWDNGYTPFINLTTQETAVSIAQGKLDKKIEAFAQAYVQWTDSGNRFAYIAPLPEMNIAGQPYSLDPVHFKQAYQHIHQIFANVGIRSPTIRWVFAPNGWSKSDHTFETYYPGQSLTDVVAFSAYNWGYCAHSDWKHWSTPQEVFEPYIQRIQRMAPETSIFIAQTATTSMTASGSDSVQKDRWLQEAYRYLAAAPNVQGILYFNIHKECDWELSHSVGYRLAVQTSTFQYQNPTEIFLQTTEGH